ncbi:MAG: GNAT family N-acetyltransferase [Pseudomonadota bacterium]
MAEPTVRAATGGTLSGAPESVTAGAPGCAPGGAPGGVSLPDMARFALASDVTWPAATVETLGGWNLRLSAEAAGSRANSAWVRSPADMAEDDAIDAVEAFYRSHGRAARFQIWPADAALDAALAARGWVPYDACAILARPAGGDWPAAGEGTAAVRLEMPLAMASRLWAEGGVGAERQAVFARAGGARALFLGRIGQQPAGMVGVTLDGEVAVTQALWVDPTLRGRGLGATLMAAAGRAAAELGATAIAHAVVTDNAPARALYARLGFQSVGHYHYRRAPA